MIGEYLTTEEVALIHKVSRSSIVQWIKKGWLSAKKVNQIYLIKEVDCNSFIRRKSTGRPRKKHSSDDYMALSNFIINGKKDD